MPTFLLLLGALGLLLGAAAAVGAVRHGKVGVVEVALGVGLVLVALPIGKTRTDPIRSLITPLGAERRC